MVHGKQTSILRFSFGHPKEQLEKEAASSAGGMGQPVKGTDTVSVPSTHMVAHNCL